MSDIEEEGDNNEEIPCTLPNAVWLIMLNLHNRLLTAIPKNNRNVFVEKLDEFYRLNFTNEKPE
jgi:hypothetical protein